MKVASASEDGLLPTSALQMTFLLMQKRLASNLTFILLTFLHACES